MKQMPTDVWSVREKLALASSVMRSGDQNWCVNLQCLSDVTLLNVNAFNSDFKLGVSLV